MIADTHISLAGRSMTEKWTITLSETDVFATDIHGDSQFCDKGHFGSECCWLSKKLSRMQVRYGCKYRSEISMMPQRVSTKELNTFSVLTETWDSEANKC